MSRSPQEMQLQLRRFMLMRKRQAADAAAPPVPDVADTMFPDAPADNFVGPLTDEQQQSKQEKQDWQIQTGAATALGENALGITTSFPVMAAAGVAGGLTQLFSNNDKATDVVNTVANWGYQPKTEAGRAVATEALAAPEKAVDTYLSYMQEVSKGTRPNQMATPVERDLAKLIGSSPLLLAGIKTAILGIPDLIGLRKMQVENAARNVAVEDIKARAQALGLDLGSSSMREQFKGIGQKAAAPEGKTEYENIVNTLKYEADIAEMRAKTVFDGMLGTDGAIRARTITIMVNESKTEILAKNFDIERMPEVRDVMATLTKLSKQEATDINDAYLKIGYVEPNALDVSNVNPKLAFRKEVKELPGVVQMVNYPKIKAMATMVERVNLATNRVRALPGGATPEDAVLQGIIKPKLEKLVEDQFMQDAIIGDPATAQMWKSSRELFQFFKDTFQADRAIATLISKDLTPSQMKSLIFGENTVNAKVASEAIVPKLIKILGEDSPQVVALRAEFNYDIVKPLLQEHPDLPGFIYNYETSVQKRPGLIKSLNPYGAVKLDDAYQFAKAIVKTGGDPNLSLNFNKITSQALFGHQIAKAAMRRSIAEATIAYVRGVGAGEQRAIIRQMLGYDPYKSMVPAGSVGFNQLTLDYYNSIFTPKEQPDDGDVAK